MIDGYFIRKADLMRNPEGPKKDICPACKKRIVVNAKGDQYCENFNLDYEKQNPPKCYWHRYVDGLNYWSSPEEIIPILAKKHNIDLSQYGVNQ